MQSKMSKNSKVFYEGSKQHGIENPAAIEIEIDESKSEKTVNFDNELECKIDHDSKPIPISAKCLEKHYSIKEVQSDNVFYSSGNYIAKYYKPSPNCKKKNIKFLLKSLKCY